MFLSKILKCHVSSDLQKYGNMLKLNDSSSAYVTHIWIFFQLQIDSQFLQPMRSRCLIPTSPHYIDRVFLYLLRRKTTSKDLDCPIGAH